MKVLLASNASYLPPRGGSTRSNLAWLEQLAGEGHECHVVAPADAAVSGRVSIHPANDAPRRAAALRAAIEELKPDWVLVSSEDLGQALLRQAHHSAPGRVVYVAHTPQFFPFGPESWNPAAEGEALVRACAALIVIGEHMAGFVERTLGRKAEVVHPPVYGHPPYARCGGFERRTVAMINPCAVKGIAIFLAVARAMPEIRFAALAGWGTTRADRAAMAGLPNLTVAETCSHIEEFLDKASVLIAPSIWYEGFGLVVTEAMLRGLPVIASDSGGLMEAKQGTRFVIPVRPPERYAPEFDEQGLPKMIAPEQDAAPWIEAVRGLLDDRELYEREAEASRTAAQRFVESIDRRRLGDVLGGLQPAAAPRISSLSPERRALLLQRLKKQ